MRNMVNSVLNIGATNIGLSESNSAVIRKLAELGSTMQSPEQIKSFPTKDDPQTEKSFGAVKLTTEEWLFFRDRWISLNTRENRLEKMVRGWEFASPPTGLGPQELTEWWQNHVKKGGFSASKQLTRIELKLNTHRDRAIKETKRQFPELRARMRYIFEEGMAAKRASKLPDSNIMDQYSSQMAPLSPLPQPQGQ